MINIQLDRLPGITAASGIGRTKIYASISAGTWTSPIHVGRASCWPRHETDALLRARIAGATDDQLRQLVRKLLEQRKALMPTASEAA